MTRRALTLFCAAALTLGAAPVAAATAASKAANAKAELRELKSRISAIQKRLAEAEESKTEAADALQASERAISDANRALAELAQQAREAGARFTEVKREIALAERDIRRQRAALSKILYEQYTAGQPEALAILLNGGNPNAIARELHYLTYIARARAEVIDGLNTDLARLEALAAEADAHAQSLASMATEQKQQANRLEQEKRSRLQVLARISRDIEKQRREIGTLKRDEARLTRLIDQLAKLIARSARPRAPSHTRPAPEARLRNDRVPEEGAVPDGPFAALRGRLALPVRGELRNRFGSPRQDGGLTWKGLFIAARAGEEVRAIAAGRVVFADWLRGFGNILIIDHGEGYMSLYGYNETLYKQVGDVIRSGERIAAVGNTGGHPDSGLYFEMRHEGRPFDPMTWVARITSAR